MTPARSPAQRLLWDYHPATAASPLVLIDGTGLFHRAYHASKGDPYGHRSEPGWMGQPHTVSTTALVAFVRVLVGLFTSATIPGLYLAPRVWICLDDPTGQTWRKSVWPHYKANRDEKPADLLGQLSALKTVVNALGFNVFQAKGHEADDLIATLARRERHADRTIIVSSDKDLFQLVNDRISVWDGRSENLVTPAEVEARFGVPPSRVLDVRCLAGDPSDGLKGVPGIGEKIAARLISEFGSLDGLYHEIYHGHAPLPDGPADSTDRAANATDADDRSAAKTALTAKRSDLLVDHQKAARETRQIMELIDVFEPPKSALAAGVERFTDRDVERILEPTPRRIPDPMQFADVIGGMGSSSLMDLIGRWPAPAAPKSSGWSSPTPVSFDAPATVPSFDLPPQSLSPAPVTAPAPLSSEALVNAALAAFMAPASAPAHADGDDFDPLAGLDEILDPLEGLDAILGAPAPASPVMPTEVNNLVSTLGGVVVATEGATHKAREEWEARRPIPTDPTLFKSGLEPADCVALAEHLRRGLDPAIYDVRTDEKNGVGMVSVHWRTDGTCIKTVMSFPPVDRDAPPSAARNVAALAEQVRCYCVTREIYIPRPLSADDQTNLF